MILPSLQKVRKYSFRMSYQDAKRLGEELLYLAEETKDHKQMHALEIYDDKNLRARDVKICFDVFFIKDNIEPIDKEDKDCMEIEEESKGISSKDAI